MCFISHNKVLTNPFILLESTLLWTEGKEIAYLISLEKFQVNEVGFSRIKNFFLNSELQIGMLMWQMNTKYFLANLANLFYNDLDWQIVWLVQSTNCVIQPLRLRIWTRLAFLSNKKTIVTSHFSRKAHPTFRLAVCYKSYINLNT